MPKKTAQLPLAHRHRAFALTAFRFSRKLWQTHKAKRSFLPHFISWLDTALSLLTRRTFKGLIDSMLVFEVDFPFAIPPKKLACGRSLSLPHPQSSNRFWWGLIGMHRLFLPPVPPLWGVARTARRSVLYHFFQSYESQHDSSKFKPLRVFETIFRLRQKISSKKTCYQAPQGGVVLISFPERKNN